MEPKKAISIFENKSRGIYGEAIFTEDLKNKETLISIKVKGLTPNSVHGFHIHEKGDLREGCKSLCNHYNPFNSPHGDITDPKTKRHVGDLGNLVANKNGVVNLKLKDKLVKLRGKYSVIGRSVILHEERDDLGRGNNQESKITGNSGARIACGIIGILF